MGDEEKLFVERTYYVSGEFLDGGGVNFKDDADTFQDLLQKGGLRIKLNPNGYQNPRVWDNYTGINLTSCDIKDVIYEIPQGNSNTIKAYKRIVEITSSPHRGILPPEITDALEERGYQKSFGAFDEETMNRERKLFGKTLAEFFI